MEFDDTLKRAYDFYKNGAMLRQAREAFIGGYKLAGLFPIKETNTKKAEIFNEGELEDLTQKLSSKLKKKAKSAEARRVRGFAVTKDNIKLNMEEIILEVENEDLEDPLYPLTDIINSLTLDLSIGLEEEVVDVIRNNAKVVDPVDLTGAWEGAELRSIARDLAKFAAGNLYTQYEPDIIAAGRDAKIELDSVYTDAASNFTVQNNGYEIHNSLYVNSRHAFAGGKLMEPGELFGFNTKAPALKIFFKKYPNSKIRQAPVAKGLEKLAPPLGLLMYDNSDEENDPTTTFKISCAYKVVPVKYGAKMLQFKNVMI